MRVTARFLAALLLTGAACSRETPVFPDTITFGERELTRSTDWHRGKMAAIVYLPPGEKLPGASLQVGVIVSGDHTTAEALHQWVIEQGARGDGPPYFSSGEPGAVCKVGAKHFDGRVRTYMALQVCKTGVARAACVEADEDLSERDFTACVGSGGGGSGGCQAICDRRWLDRREPLDLLAADVLTRR
jgi:hypothetical protein